jgi:YgiT-type zinc finger domain-containing protein
MICANCGEPTAYIYRSTRAFGKGSNLLVIENVPIITCRECGAEFLSGLTSGQIDRWYAQYSDLATRPVPVVTFQDEEDPALAELAETAPPLRW